MRKIALSFITAGLVVSFIFINSCKREVAQPGFSNDATTAKVNIWLDQQKKGKLPNKIANIDLLKNNLDPLHMRFERSGNYEQFLIVPIQENFKSLAGIDKNSVPDLVLFINKDGDIRYGNIVLYTPENGQADKIPGNTFYDIFNTAQPESNGKFQFLAVTGTPQYQLQYKNRHLVSSGLYQSKVDSSRSGRANSICINWYLVTTYYDTQGNVVSETWQYLYTTCGGECGSPRYMSLCAGDGGGGGTSVVPDNSCINAAVKQFQQEVNGAKATFQPESNHISSIDDFTKHKDPKWTILSGFGAWHLSSQEIGIIKLINASTRTWAWQSLAHGAITMSGSTLPTTSVEYDQGTGTPSFTPSTAATSNIFYAGMSLNFSVTYHLVCHCPNIPVLGWMPPIHVTYTSTALWDANPI